MTLSLLILAALLLLSQHHWSEAFSSGPSCRRPHPLSSSSSSSVMRSHQSHCIVNHRTESKHKHSNIRRRDSHWQRQMIQWNDDQSPDSATATAITTTTTTDENGSWSSLLRRRDALFRTANALSVSALMMAVHPSPGICLPEEEKVYLRGTVTLQSGLSLPSLSDQTQAAAAAAALYITVRPNVPDDASRAILDGTRGKSPPVLSARFPVVPSTTSEQLIDFFPFEFELTRQNLTPEGAYLPPTGSGSAVEQDEAAARLWWENSKDLIVSARLDTDGVASTRDPEDLVGRGISSIRPSDNAYVVSVELRGRGMFGKSVTGRK